MNEFDITEEDFNPTIFFASKEKMLRDDYYHDHDFAEITYILSGNGKYYINGTTYEVRAGDIIMCNPGVKHHNIVVDEKEPTVEVFIGFTNFRFKNMPPNSIIFKNNEYIMHTSGELKKETTRICWEMVAEQMGDQVGKYFMLKAQLMKMLLLIMRELLGGEMQEKQNSYNFESYNKNYVVRRIITYLDENYASKISLDKIARNMYLSPVYISKIFKEETGESPINYLIKIRLEKAKDILVNGDGGSIKVIANSVGYDDVYHFSKLFKKHYGISPLYYRKTMSKVKA